VARQIGLPPLPDSEKWFEVATVAEAVPAATSGAAVPTTAAPAIPAPPRRI